METRLQILNGDAILEITDTQQVKTRHSESRLRERKATLEDAISHFNEEIAGIDLILSQIQDAKDQRK